MEKPTKQYSDRQVRAALNYAEAQLELMAAFGHAPESMEMRLLAKYGECMKQTEAAEELDIVPTTVRTMLRDGRLERTGGDKVSTFSLAQYLENPKDSNAKAKRRKQQKPKLAIVQ